MSVGLTATHEKIRPKIRQLNFIILKNECNPRKES